MTLSEPIAGGAQTYRRHRVASRSLLPAVGRLRTGLAARLALYTAILGIIVAGVLTRYMYQGSADALVAGERHELAATNEAAGRRFNDRIEFTREDALILSRLPEIATLAGSRRSGGFDPANAAGAEQGLARLTAAFRTMLEERPGYALLRYIAADGREAVRVERLVDGRIATAPPQALRNLADRPYFDKVKGLPKGGVYVSDVALSQPNGTIEQPHRFVVRAAAPAYDPAGHLTGVVVVDADLSRLFGFVAQTADRQSLHFVTDRHGDYLYRPEVPRAFGTAARQSGLIQDALPELAAVFAPGGSRFSGVVHIGGQRYVADARRVYFDPQRQDRYLVLATLWPRARVAKEIAALWNRTLLVAMFLLFVGVLAVAVLVNRLVHPLRALTEAATQLAAGEREVGVDVAVSRRDEVGELARSFTVMAARIRQREEEVRRSAEERARSQELAQFAYVASHDLQEPLRMVDSYLGLLARRYGDRLDGDAREFIDFAVDGARRMKGLINDLLEYSRVTNRSLDLESVAMATVLAKVVRMLADRIADGGVEVTAGPLPTVRADPNQMERLLTNLVGNAVKYRAAVRPRVHVAAGREGDRWVFSVADNGIGIEPEFREKVFEIFKRLHGRDKYPGTGIGLASCRRIVERHGGEIWVDETPGGGATFRFTLPDRMAAEGRDDEP